MRQLIFASQDALREVDDASDHFQPEPGTCISFLA
jgi:hypothetical protein